jgi:hypothetical protein
MRALKLFQPFYSLTRSEGFNLLGLTMTAMISYMIDLYLPKTKD